MLNLSRSLAFASRWVRYTTSSAVYVFLCYARPSTTESFGSKEAEIAAQVVPGRALQAPYHHPRTHDVPVASIHFRSHHVRLLDIFTHFATHAASSLGIPCSKVIHLPTQRRLWTVLRSPFAHKKSQENFERKVHKRVIKAWDAHPEVVEQWVKYMRAHAIGGVGWKVTRWEHLPLGVGEKRYKDVVLELEASPADQIKDLGEKILSEELGSASAPAPMKPADT